MNQARGNLKRSHVSIQYAQLPQVYQLENFLKTFQGNLPFSLIIPIKVSRDDYFIIIVPWIDHLISSEAQWDHWTNLQGSAFTSYYLLLHQNTLVSNMHSA